MRASEETATTSAAERTLRLTLALAILASCGSIYLILQQHHRVGVWVEKLELLSTSSLTPLKEQLSWQLWGSFLVLGILLFCQTAMWRVRHKYVSGQRDLRQVKMLAHDILASMDRGVVTTNHDGIITSINSAGISLLDIDFECVGTPLASISSPNIPLHELCREVLSDGSTVCDRDFKTQRTGRLMQLRTDAHVLKDSAGMTVGCVIHLRDMTERMLLEDQMRRMERFLDVAMLASGLHHEIKNPLTALSIHIQLLEENLPTTGVGSDLEEFVGILKTEVSRLNGVLESFRSFANLQQLVLQPTDVLELVENVIRLIDPQAAKQHVEISLLRPANELPIVPVDADKIERAVLNLVINALEAMPDGGKLELHIEATNDVVRLAVADSGFGIPPEVQRNMFRPYFSTKSKGTGIGLALSEKLISQHGGQISYRTGNDGTTFEINIPLEGIHQSQ